MPGAPSSAFVRTVSTTTRLHVSRPTTKGLRLALSQPAPLSSPHYSQRLYQTAGATSSIPTQSTRPRSRLRRLVGFASIAVVAFSVGVAYQTQRTVSRIMPASLPTDEETLTAFTPQDEFTLKVENHIRDHPLAVSLREDPGYVESRPYMKMPEKFRSRNLTAGTLSNPGGIAVPPYVFCNDEEKTLVSIMYLGSNVSGHPGIVHGGLLATLLDEGMGRCCFPALPNKVGVTANLNVDYRRPAMANSYYVLRAQVVKVEGRKAWIESRIESLPEEGEEPVVFVEAKSLFVEPKQAAAMASLYNISK